MNPVLKFESEFIEEAVYQILSSNKQLAESFNTEIKPNDLKQKIEETFEKLGFHRAFESLISEFPILKNSELTISVKRVFSLGREGSRLAEGESKVVILGLLPKRLLNHALFEIFLRQELLRASDMLDPLFGYEPMFNGDRCADEESARRFLTLWNLYISVRLGYEGIQIYDSSDKDERLFQITYFHLQKGVKYPSEIADQLNAKGYLTQGDLLQLVNQITTK